MRRLGQIALGFALALACPVIGRAAAAAVPVSTAGFNQTFRGDGAKLTVESPLAIPPRFGFVPFRLAVDNQLPREVEWRANFTSTQSTGSSMSTTTQRTFDSFVAPGGRSHERWLFVPLADGGFFRGNYFYRGPVTGTIAGPGIGSVSFSLNNPGAASIAGMTPWAVSASLDGAVRARIGEQKVPVQPAPFRVRGGRPVPTSPPTPGPTTRPLISTPYNIFVFEPAQPLGDWRIWSPFARVVIRSGEFASLDAANRVALRNWVALGGVLYLVSDDARPGGTEYFGAGSIVRLGGLEDGRDAGLFSSAGLQGGTLAQPSSDELSQERTKLSVKLPGNSGAGDWLAYFFIIFALVIAPVNLFALAPARRRHRLFFTVPAISFAAVVLLGTIILVQDGFGGRGARRALVVLLPGDNQAAIFQEQVSRTGMLLGSQFPLANDVLCAQLPIDGNAANTGGINLQRGDGRASGEWFRSRAGQAQHLRRLTPTRARVERVGVAPDGGPVVQSSVGTTLRDFLYVDEAGQAWGAATVAPGTRVNLTRVADADVAFKKQVEEFAEVSSVHFGQVTRASATPSGLARGRFVARSDDSELAPIPTLDAIRWEDSTVLVTGVLENTEAKNPAPGRAGE